MVTRARAKKKPLKAAPAAFVSDEPDPVLRLADQIVHIFEERKKLIEDLYNRGEGPCSIAQGIIREVYFCTGKLPPKWSYRNTGGSGDFRRPCRNGVQLLDELQHLPAVFANHEDVLEDTFKQLLGTGFSYKRLLGELKKAGITERVITDGAIAIDFDPFSIPIDMKPGPELYVVEVKLKTTGAIIYSDEKGIGTGKTG